MKPFDEQTPLSFTSFPDIGLYMDQVLAYLGRQQSAFGQEEKVTPAMVNNYIKAGLVPRAKGKRYGREHLAYLSIVCRLKQVLSVRDMQVLLTPQRDGEHAEQWFDNVMEQLHERWQQLEGSMQAQQECSEQQRWELAMALALDSYVSKMACQALIRSLEEEKHERN